MTMSMKHLTTINMEETLLTNTSNYQGRFKGLPWFGKLSDSMIFIGGAGGIGSHLAFQLARTGANILIADMDIVGEENLAGQLYGKEDIDQTKVRAIATVIERLCGNATVSPMNTEITDDPDASWRAFVQASDIVCVGFDNLQARRLIYEEWKAYGKDVSVFVDGRLAAESGQVFVVPRDSPEAIYKAYEATYFSESERTELPCTMKATTHCGALIAAFMVGQITNWCNNVTKGTMEREICNIEFHIPLMMFDVSRFKVNSYATEELQS